MRTVVITGISSGIGQALAVKFADAGWRVVGSARDPSRLRRTDWPGEIHFEGLDLAIPGSPREFASRVTGRFGVPDTLVNSAGALLFGSVEDTSLDRIEHLFLVNVFAQVDLIMSFVPGMRERGSGTIVNVTSVGGRLVFPFFAVYNATKHALEGFSEGLWHELKPFGIRVIAIEPGFVDTPIWRKAMGPLGAGADSASDPYRPYQEAMARFENAVRDRTPPAQAAEEIFDAVTDGTDRLRYPVAAYARALLRARRLFGDMALMRFLHRRCMGG